MRSSHERIQELLAHNNVLLERARAERRRVDRLRDVIEELVLHRSPDYLATGDRLMLLGALRETESAPANE